MPQTALLQISGDNLTATLVPPSADPAARLAALEREVAALKVAVRRLEEGGVIDPPPPPPPPPEEPPPPPPPGAPEPRKGIGTNFKEITDWLTDDPVGDYLLRRREWVSITGAPPTIDDAGHVTALAPGAVVRGYLWTDWRKTGQYSLRVDDWSKARQVRGFDCATSYEEDAQRIVIAVPPTGNTGIEIVGGVGAPPRPLELRYQGDPPPVAGMWRAAFVERMRRYRCLRFMDWQRTNGAETAEQGVKRLRSAAELAGDFAAQRPATFARDGRGPRIRDLVELAAGADVAPWFCVPAIRDDAAAERYTQQLCEVIANLLPAHLPAYVEHSNEVWNTRLDFPQSRAFSGNFDENMAWHGRRSSMVHRIAKQVLGARAITVLGCHVANPWWTGHHLDLLEAARLPTPDVVAIGPYLHGDTIEAQLLALPQVMAWTREHMAVGKPVIAYEGGQHANPAAAAAVSRDARMEQVYDRLLDAWRETTNDALLCHYVHVSRSDWGGAWGEKEYFDQAETPKSRAIGRRIGR